MFCVQVMHMTTLNKSLLISLLNLAQSDQAASVQLLAIELGVSRAVVAGGLNELVLEGLVRPETIRLTFVGLMHATGLRNRVAQSAAA